MTDDQVVTITLRDIYEQVCHVEAKLDAFLSRYEGAQFPEKVADHEKRLRRMEAWMYAIPAAVIVAVGNAVAMWLVR